MNDYETEERIGIIADGCRVSQDEAERIFKGLLPITGNEQVTMAGLLDSTLPPYQRKGHTHNRES